jgi:hypothetical protein
MEVSKSASVPCKPLALVAQLPEFPHLAVVHRRPPTEKDGHALVALALCLLELIGIERGQVRGEILDHAPVPCSLPAGCLSSPNHFRSFRPKLLRTCISTSFPPLLARSTMAVKAGRDAREDPILAAPCRDSDRPNVAVRLRR